MQNDRNAHPVKKEQPFQAFKMANTRSYFRNMCHMNGRCTWSRQKKHSKDASTIRQRFDKSLFSTAWTSAGLGCESMSLLREHAGVYGHITRYTEKNIDRTCNRAMTANNLRGEIQGQPLADRQAIILPIWQIFKIVVSANKFGLMSDIVHPASNLERFTIRHSDDFCFGVIGETFTCYECQNCPLPIKEGTKVSEKNCQACQIQFTLTESGKVTRVNAACKKTAEECQPSYNASGTSADVVACCGSSNCNSMPGSGLKILPGRVSLLPSLVLLLYSNSFGNP
ncbi:hypothetical protein CSKR_113939 [Clonorchis sinensis]|uniref:Uncharacterized protein n=1 Tax=Clonorchis sinensis TaxID=79923 RepID=A0A3R7F0C9_CLOSI|nr:hypothetical protein CSKR_113939 [Clonorchis sinensis]